MSQAIGIDLGTTFSAVAVMRDGKPTILHNAEGDTTTPSVVLFPDYGQGQDEPLVGSMAKQQIPDTPDDAASFVKRFMGDPNWKFDSSATTYTSEEISAIILKKLKQDAELALGETVTDAVITVPAYFDDARRTATKQAGKIAGLNVLRIINEPTAAALAYGVNSQKQGNVLVYDLGGGTFDVTVLRIDNGGFTVLGTDGDRNLGGFDFDNELINICADELKRQGISDPLSDTKIIASLRDKAETAKKTLTNAQNATVQVAVNGKHFKIQITRDQFEKASASLLRRTQELVEDVLEEASLTWSDIDHVLLIGGSTRMPMIREMVTRLSGKSPELNVNPDEAVALGAAIQASLETSGASSVNAGGIGLAINDVTSQALGVIQVDFDGKEVNTVVIPKNNPVPSKKTVSGRTIFDNQTVLQVQVTQGEDPDPKFVTIVGESNLEIPAYPKGAPIDITYVYDPNQTITIEVFDKTANKSVGTFEIERVANLSNAEVDSASRRVGKMSVS